MGLHVTIPIAILVSIVCAVSVAEARVDVRNMSCKSAAALVKKNRAVVMTTGKGKYSRIVASQNSCDSSRRFQTRTKDNKRCFVGYQCSGNMGGR